MGVADVAKLKDRYWGPYKILRWVNAADDVELEIPKSNTGAHNVFHIRRLKKAADSAEARLLELPRRTRKGFPSKITVEDKGYEISGIVGHHDYALGGEKQYKREYLR